MSSSLQYSRFNKSFYKERRLIIKWLTFLIIELQIDVYIKLKIKKYYISNTTKDER